MGSIVLNVTIVHNRDKSIVMARSRGNGGMVNSFNSVGMLYR